jgi:hypothetical protein
VFWFGNRKLVFCSALQGAVPIVWETCPAVHSVCMGICLFLETTVQGNLAIGIIFQKLRVNSGFGGLICYERY